MGRCQWHAATWTHQPTDVAGEGEQCEEWESLGRGEQRQAHALVRVGRHLEIIQLGDSVSGESPRIVADVSHGRQRLVVYADRDSCGFLTTAAETGGTYEPPISISSAWPVKDNAQSSDAGGPFHTVRGVRGRQGMGVLGLRQERHGDRIHPCRRW